MRKQYRSFVVTMLVVSLCCGFIGCKSNGGRWYKPTSYTWYNPFKKFANEDDEYGRFAEDNNGNKLPKSGQEPDLDLPTPPGGYSDRSQVAQNTNRSTGVNVPGSTGGGYPLPSQNSSIAMNTQDQYVNPPNRPVNYTSAPQGQPVVQNQYYQNQPSNQYPNYNSPPGGTTQIPNQNYGSNPNTNYSMPTGQQYDPSYGTSQSPSNSYSTGYNTYSDEYQPGSWR